MGAAVAYMTLEAFLEQEAAAEVKHEFVGRQVVMMAGARNPHNRIATAFLINLGNELRNKGRGCEPFNSDQMVKADADYYFYTDVSVACPPFEFVDSNERVLANCSLVVEVLSESTATYDLTTKLVHYQNNPAIQQIVFIDSRKVNVISYARVNGLWLPPVQYHLMDQIIHLNHLQIELPMQSFYGGVVANGSVAL